MSRFQVKIEKGPNHWDVKMSGVIDEDARFDLYPLSGAPRLIIDTTEIKSINSCGIREWIVWIGGAGIVPIELKNCPKVIVDQINMVQGFLPGNAKVTSFFVPYYSDESGEEKLVLYQFGKEFTESGLKSPPQVSDAQGKPMEVDVVEAKYFKFLQKAA